MADQENLHPNIPNNMLHVAKGYSEGSAGNKLVRTRRSEQKFTFDPVLPPALDFVDPHLAPPTENSDDIYVLKEGTAVHADWDSGAYFDHLEYDSTADLWRALTPSGGNRCYDKTEEVYWTKKSDGWLRDPVVLHQSQSVQGNDADTNEKTVATHTLERNTFIADRSGQKVHLYIHGKHVTGNNNSVTLKVYYGGHVIYSVVLNQAGEEFVINAIINNNGALHAKTSITQFVSDLNTETDKVSITVDNGLQPREVKVTVKSTVATANQVTVDYYRVEYSN